MKVNRVLKPDYAVVPNLPKDLDAPFTVYNLKQDSNGVCVYEPGQNCNKKNHYLLVSYTNSSSAHLSGISSGFDGVFGSNASYISSKKSHHYSHYSHKNYEHHSASKSKHKSSKRQEYNESESKQHKSHKTKHQELDKKRKHKNQYDPDDVRNYASFNSNSGFRTNGEYSKSANKSDAKYKDALKKYGVSEESVKDGKGRFSIDYSSSKGMISDAQGILINTNNSGVLRDAQGRIISDGKSNSEYGDSQSRLIDPNNIGLIRDMEGRVSSLSDMGFRKDALGRLINPSKNGIIRDSNGRILYIPDEAGVLRDADGNALQNIDQLGALIKDEHGNIVIASKETVLREFEGSMSGISSQFNGSSGFRQADDQSSSKLAPSATGDSLNNRGKNIIRNVDNSAGAEGDVAQNENSNYLVKRDKYGIINDPSNYFSSGNGSGIFKMLSSGYMTEPNMLRSLNGTSTVFNIIMGIKISPYNSNYFAYKPAGEEASSNNLNTENILSKNQNAYKSGKFVVKKQFETDVRKIILQEKINRLNQEYDMERYQMPRSSLTYGAEQSHIMFVSFSILNSNSSSSYSNRYSSFKRAPSQEISLSLCFS